MMAASALIYFFDTMECGRAITKTFQVDKTASVNISTIRRSRFKSVQRFEFKKIEILDCQMLNCKRKNINSRGSNFKSSFPMRHYMGEQNNFGTL